MKDNIIVDTLVDFNEKIFGPGGLIRIPFKINIDGVEIVDDKRDQTDLLARMKSCKDKLLTACPSPDDFLYSLKRHATNYIVTVSSKLSASYQSALLAKDMLLESAPDTIVHVFDSMSACAGESLVVMKLKQLMSENLNPDHIKEKLNEYISRLNTLILLDSYNNLVKSGRVSPIKAAIGSLLQIVPIMGSNYNGEIELKEQVRGKQKALRRLVELIGETVADAAGSVMAITHANAPAQAEYIRMQILGSMPFKDIIIFEASGLSTVYMDDGGIVLAF